jgi:hypothetical protein
MLRIFQVLHVIGDRNLLEQIQGTKGALGSQEITAKMATLT